MGMGCHLGRCGSKKAALVFLVHRRKKEDIIKYLSAVYIPGTDVECREIIELKGEAEESNWQLLRLMTYVWKSHLIQDAWHISTICVTGFR